MKSFRETPTTSRCGKKNQMKNEKQRYNEVKKKKNMNGSTIVFASLGLSITL